MELFNHFDRGEEMFHPPWCGIGEVSSTKKERTLYDMWLNSCPVEVRYGTSPHPPKCLRLCLRNPHRHVDITMMRLGDGAQALMIRISRFKVAEEMGACLLRHTYLTRKMILSDNPFEYNSWKAMKKRYHDIEPLLMRLCEKAHQEAGYGEAAKVDTVTLNQWTLLFDNEDFRSRKVDVVTYTTEDTENRWYITEGVRKDCVYYLHLMSPQQREFKLEKQVCRLYRDFETVPINTHFRVDS